MTQPTVCAVCLTANRPAMVARAIRCFRAQDYDPTRRGLVILDSGDPPITPDGSDSENEIYFDAREYSRATVGRLRNLANAFVPSEVIVHWDDDDWSAPARISDQVKLLVESGKQAVGYREMLFWREPWVASHIPTIRIATDPEMEETCEHKPGEAWLYRNIDMRYIISTSACYWRRTWEEKPFDDVPTGEVGRWIKGLDTLGTQSWEAAHSLGGGAYEYGPAMIATIHGGNTVKQHIFPHATNPDGSLTWTRVPAWDARCRAILEAA